MSRTDRRRFARRVGLGLMILAALLAACAILFHRMHAQALDEARALLEQETTRRADRAAAWLAARRDAFAAFARPAAADQAGGNPDLERLRRADPAFAFLATVDGSGRVLSGSTGGSAEPGDLVPPPGTGPGEPVLLASPDGGVRVLFFLRPGQGEDGPLLLAEADPRSLAEVVADGAEQAAWFLLPERGPALFLGGSRFRDAAPVLDLFRASRGRAASAHSEPLLLAAAPLTDPRGDTFAMGLGASVRRPDTPYHDLGLALTVLAAACLAYSGYVRARALKS